LILMHSNTNVAFESRFQFITIVLISVTIKTQSYCVWNFVLQSYILNFLL
jgi:hypothetical protein